MGQKVNPVIDEWLSIDYKEIEIEIFHKISYSVTFSGLKKINKYML